LRFSVFICCCLVGLALIVQSLTWSLASFTDLRYEAPAPAPNPLVSAATVDPDIPETRMVVDTNGPSGAAARSLSRYDAIFATAVTFTRVVGSLALVLLLLLLGIAVMLTAGTATAGVEQTVSAFVIGALIATLVLPLAPVLNLPWYRGALHTYPGMIETIETMARGSSFQSTISLYGQFFLMPLVCVMSVVAVWMRFADGVAAALVQPEAMTLDAQLEAEVARIKPGSLHSTTRAAGALRNLVGEQPPSDEAAPESSPNEQSRPMMPATGKPMSGAGRPLSPGTPLKRPI
jgi:hypothetical protein